MRKTLTCFSFVIASLLVIATFVTARTYTQLGVAIFLYPPLIYVAYELFIRKTYKAPEIEVRLPVKSVEKVEPEITKIERARVDVADIDKRAFLKLIGTAGISFFLFSILNRRFESLFFGRAAQSGISALNNNAGNNIDPAERQPTDGYRISEIDDNIIAFYGFVNKEGAWFILKENPDDGSFRYTKGETDFSNNWTSRENLQYDYYHNIF